MPVIKHTMMREDFSTVNARQYSAERNEVTIQMALDSIGPLYRTLLLTDEDDGVWTINTNLTIPQNVTLGIPLGTTLVGPGNITILGGLTAFRWLVHLGPGIIVMDNATLGAAFSKLNIGDLNADEGWFRNLYIADSLYVGRGAAVGPDDPWPVQPPIPTLVDWSTITSNYYEIGAQQSQIGGQMTNSWVKLTADTLVGCGTEGLNSYTFLDLNNHHFRGLARGLESVPIAFSSAPSGGGTLDSAECLTVGFYPQDNTMTTSVAGFMCYGLIPENFTGGVGTYYGLAIANVADLNVTTIYCIHSTQNISATPATKTRYNLWIAGSAPSYMMGSLSIGSVPIQAPTYYLHVNGIAQKPGGGSWTDSSSATMKRAIEPLTGALDTMLRLRGTSYLWRDEEHARLFPHRQIGFIAEEVLEVLPEWITETPEGELLLTERGTFAMTVEAVRDLDARLRALEGKEPRDVPKSYAGRSGTPEE